MTDLMLNENGTLTLPDALRERYHLSPNTPVRLIETRDGLLLIPMTQEPMSTALAQEIEEWQALSKSSWEAFAYEDENA